MGTLPGMFAGLAIWFALALKSAFAMVGIGAFARLIWGDAAASEQLVRTVAAGCCLVFIVLNTLSVKMTGRSQVVMVIGLLAALILFVSLGAPRVQQHPNFDDFMGRGFGSVLVTAGLVFISFGGLTKVANVAEEVRDPGRTCRERCSWHSLSSAACTLRWSS